MILFYHTLMTSSIPMDKPLLVIDVDTTIYDHRSMIQRAYQYTTGRTLPVKNPDSMDPSTYYHLMSYPQHELTQLSRRCRELDYWNSLPILDGAKAATEYLQKHYNILLLSFVPEKIRKTRLDFYQQHGLDAHYILMIDNPNWRAVAPELTDCLIITAQQEWKKDPHALVFTAQGGWTKVLETLNQ